MRSKKQFTHYYLKGFLKQAKVLLENSKAFSNQGSKDIDFFNWHFLKSTIEATESVILLSKRNLNRQASIITRQIFELYVYFIDTNSNPDLASKWRLYVIYEDYRYMKFAYKITLEKFKLKAIESGIPESLIEKAFAEFPPEKNFNNWYKKNDVIRTIIEKHDDRFMYEDKITHKSLSCTVHMSPWGLFGNSDMFILTNSLRVLICIAHLFDKTYSLGQNKKLDNLWQGVQTFVLKDSDNSV
ncbi:DUF5677 domain-containing protein [Patescibacteria group bacterium]